MKKAEREIYRVLAEEMGFAICGGCKFHECYGSPCDGGDDDCVHPLSEEINFPLEKADGFMEPGMDCWAFRPGIKVADLADICGIVLAQGWEEWFWQVFKDGTIKVYGHRF